MQEYHLPYEIDSITQKLTDMIKTHYVAPTNQPVVPFRTKSQLLEEISEADCPLEGLGLTETLTYFEEHILKNSIKTWHPLFLNQMFAGASLPAIVGDMLASMMNPTLATWEMSPTATIVERNVSQWMASMIGMPEGSSGIFLPGGSLSNLLALTVARERLSPDISQKGVANVGEKGAILCSDAAHYSIKNAGKLLGIGSDNVILVETNERNEMLPEDLRAKLAWCDREGLTPFAVVATMGITVTGGFDPLEAIVDICADRDIHIHVDAAFGGGLCLTDRGPNLFKGIERADTVIWDAHKWFHVPLTCTVLIAPDARIFKHVFSSNANYLFHPQEEEIDVADDLGQYTILCGKRFEALRVWILLKAFGENYFRKLAQDRLAFTLAVAELIRACDDFTLSYEPISPIICFRYQPPALRDRETAFVDRMHRYIREQAKKQGLAMFNISQLKGCDHFRMILINPLTERKHMVKMLDDIRSLSAEFISQNAG